MREKSSDFLRVAMERMIRKGNFCGAIFGECAKMGGGANHFSMGPKQNIRNGRR